MCLKELATLTMIVINCSRYSRGDSKAINGIGLTQSADPNYIQLLDDNHYCCRTTVSPCTCTMAHQTTWGGSVGIKGYNSTHRMAMLTFCLIGLQHAFFFLELP
jgi:hypothetical protein